MRAVVSAMALGLCIMVIGTRFAWALIPNQQSDADTLGLISIIEQYEIQAAQLATQKNIDPEVLNFAKMLNKEISEHLNATQKLSQELKINPADNTSSINQVRNKNEMDLAALTHLDGTAFAQLYIADTIKGHTEVSSWIENQGSQNEQINDFLKDTRKQVDMNLDKALEIQKYQKTGQG